MGASAVPLVIDVAYYMKMNASHPRGPSGELRLAVPLAGFLIGCAVGLVLIALTEFKKQ